MMVLALVVGAAWSGLGLGKAVPFALDRVLPAGWRADVGAVEGSWMGRIVLSEVTLEGSDIELGADRLSIRYRILPLLGRTVDVSAVVLEGPTAKITLADSASSDQASDSVDDSVAFGGTGVASLLAGEPVGGWTVRVGSVEIVDGGAVLQDGQEGTYSLQSLRLVGRGGLGPEGLAVDIDTLSTDFVSSYEAPGDSAFRSEGRVMLSGTLEDGVLGLDTLALVSDHSDVAGGGRMVFVRRTELWRTAAAEIRARPLDLRDLPIRLPQALREQSEVNVRLSVEGSPDSVMMSLDADGLEGRTTARTDVVARSGNARSADAPGAEARPAIEGSLAFDGLDLGTWAGPRFEGVADGRLSFTMEHLSGDGRYAVDGFVHARPPRIDPSSLAARPLRAEIVVRGGLPGDSTVHDGPRADAELTLFAERPSARLGRLTTTLQGATVRWSVDLTLDSARVEGGGAADWRTTPMTGSVEALRVAHLDLDAIDSIYPSTDLTGRVQGRFQGSTLDDLRGAFDLALAPSSWAGTTLDTLAVEAEVRGGSYEGSLRAASGWGDVRTRYVVELGDSVLRYETEELAYVRTDSTGQTLAEVHGRAAGSWALADRRGGTLDATLDSARWRTTRVADARITAELDGERVVADAELDALAGLGGLRARLEVDGEPDSLGAGPGSLSAETRSADVEAAGAIGPEPRAGGVPPTRTRIRAHADVTGATLATATGSAWATAERIAVGGGSARDTLRVELTASDPGRFELTGAAAPAEGGNLSVTASARVGPDSLWFEASARGGFPEPVALLDGAAFDSLGLEASGRRVGGVWRTMDGRLSLTDGRWRELVAERGRASVSYDSSGVRVDTLELRTNVLAASGSGRLPMAGDAGRVELQGELLDLEPVRRMVGLEVLTAGEGSVQATATGSLDSLEWSGAVDVEAVVVSRARMTGLRLEGEGVASAPYDFLLGLASTDVSLTLDRIVLPESEVRRVSVEAAGGPDSIRVAAEAMVDDRRNALILVHVDPRPEGRTARIEDMRFQVDEDEWSLTEEAVLRYRTGFSLEPVLLRAGQQEIRLEGGVSQDGVLDLNARMDSTDVATVADLVGFPRLRGWLSGRVRVQGTTQSPEAWLDMAGAFHRTGRTPGPVEARIRANGRRVQGEVQLVDASQGSLTLTGGALLSGTRGGVTQATGPGADAGPGADDGAMAADSTILGFASDSIDVALEADSFDVRWMEAFFTAEALPSLGGRLHGSLTLAGSTEAPRLAGGLRLRNGSARPAALGVSWDQVSMTVRGDGRDIVVDSARISGSSGDATVAGSVGVVGAMPLDLTVSLDDFRAIQTDVYRAVTSGTVDVGGVVAEPVLEGRVRLESLDVYLDERVTSENLEPVTLSEEDLRILRERFGVVPDPTQEERPLAERLTADLEVVFGRDSWLRKRTNPEMAVPFSGTIDVRLRPGEEPSLQGSVDVVEGRGFVEQFGRRFALTGGTVTFEGVPAETSVDLEATYRVPSRDNPDDAEVTIILEVTGTQDDLALTFSSTPPLENADIISYIATGRPASGSLGFQGDESSEGGGIVSAGADLALGRMTAAIENAVARSVGLDVVEIRREGLREATLVAGKYLTPRLYVGFAQPLSGQQDDGLSSATQGHQELEIEYEALRWLLINIEGSGSSLRFFLRGRHAY